MDVPTIVAGLILFAACVVALAVVSALSGRAPRPRCHADRGASCSSCGDETSRCSEARTG